MSIHSFDLNNTQDGAWVVFIKAPICFIVFLGPGVHIQALCQTYTLQIVTNNQVKNGSKRRISPGGPTFCGVCTGGIIGFERESQGSPAGIRTYTAITLTAALFTLIGVHSPDTTASGRIVANIVTGIGFMGADIIYNNLAERTTHGLTTASSIWGAAGIGVAVAYTMYFIAVGATVAIYFLLALQHVKWYIQFKEKAVAKSQKRPKQEN